MFSIETSSPSDKKTYEEMLAELAKELHRHNEGDIHLGMSDNLDLILTTLYDMEYKLNGIHRSCISGKFYSFNKGINIDVACVMFTNGAEENRYHVGLIGCAAEDLENVMDEITSWYTYKGTDIPTWTERKWNDVYFVKSWINNKNPPTQQFPIDFF